MDMGRVVLLIFLIAAFMYVPTILRKVFRDEYVLPDYDQEILVWARLESSGLPATARVEKLARDPQRMTWAGSYGNNEVAGVELSVAFEDAQQRRHVASVTTYIDTEILANFAVGHEVGIVYDPAKPAVFAIDRRRTPTEIPPSRE